MKSEIWSRICQRWKANGSRPLIRRWSVAVGRNDRTNGGVLNLSLKHASVCVLTQFQLVNAPALGSCRGSYDGPIFA